MDLTEEGTHPTCSYTEMSNVTGDNYNCRDEASEEAWHFVCQRGLAPAYPEIFGYEWKSKSKLTNAMDIARYSISYKGTIQTIFSICM